MVTTSLKNAAGYIRYRGKQQELTESEYNRDLMNAALEAGIEVIGLADHGSVNGVDSIRTLFNQNGIIVFPGFEIASSEKIHFVCLFDESKSSQELERILGSLKLLDPQDGIRPSRLSAEQLIDEVNQLGGFIFAAHCTNDNGLLKIGQMNHVWQHKGLLAAQIPGSIDDLRGIESDFYRKVFLNKEANYRREREMAAINAADVESPEKIKEPGASCLIKMTKPCFSSFKQAFLDAGSRVRFNSDKPENYASAIERIRFIDGYMDGVDIELSDHLNAVIGGRGTGKSTFLECIRYAFALEAKTPNAQKQHKSIVDSNLGKELGTVEVTLRSSIMHGRRFTISRKYDHQPVVVDDLGKISPYAPIELIPSVELYGQNEIYEMICDEHSRNKLIQRFLKGEHEQFDECISRVLTELKENREQIIRARGQQNETESDVEKLPKLLDQAEQFKSLGIDEKLKKIPLLEKEKLLNERVSSDLDDLKINIELFKNKIPDSTYLSPEALDGLSNASLLQQQKKILDDLLNGIKQAVTQIEELTLTAIGMHTSVSSTLSAKQLAEDQNIKNSFKAIPASQGKTGQQIGVEYQNIQKQIEQIRPKETELQSKKSEIDELYKCRRNLLLQLEQTRKQRTSCIMKSVKRLTRKLENKLKLSLQPEGNRQVLFDFLNGCELENIGVKRLSWVLEGSFTPTALASSIRDGKDLLSIIYDIPEIVVKALITIPESKLLELEEVQLSDTMTLELNVNNGTQNPVFKDIEELSTGQKCTAVLHLLLLENNDPLILDQPEDNLDNAFIAERIVGELRREKLCRQFLFATHNANIPVFGDAEWIGVLTVKDNKGNILPEEQGAIDVPRVQELAANILEGGKSAFNQRREKYGFA